ncbi:MAG: hypothetical protein ABIQ27_03330 [Flavobacterium sp.]|uniref:hypothetical protein n=1 Tax=Flavobacterium sp. TaxID=239 RepID=UPI0032670806
MNEQTNLSKYDKIVESTNEAIQNVDSAFQNCNNIISTIDYSIDKISATVIQVKEIEKSIKILDCQVELMCKEYDMRIEKCKIQASIVQNTLNGLSNRNDKILDTILAMDSNSNDINYIKHRSELINLLRNTSDTISNMFIHFILN